MSAADTLQHLMEGNRRFRTSSGTHYTYGAPSLSEIARSQSPMAAVVACADSRLTPEVIFDQPLGSLFVSRVPANVASDSAKWMIDIAVLEFKVPLLIVLGHTGCLAVAQVVDGQTSGTGGALRLRVARAVMHARTGSHDDLGMAAVEENARQTVRDLAEESSALGSALRDGQIEAVAAIYEMETGEVRLV